MGTVVQFQPRHEPSTVDEMFRFVVDLPHNIAVKVATSRVNSPATRLVTLAAQYANAWYDGNRRSAALLCYQFMLARHSARPDVLASCMQTAKEMAAA